MEIQADLRERAWRALVKELGLLDAIRFCMGIEPHEGDSIEEIKIWEGKKLEEIHEVIKAKRKCKI